MNRTSARHAVDRLLSLFAWLVLAFMVLVILEGAIVRATGSGAGCGNHWPLCNGEVFPHHPRVATIIEFIHRSMTGVLSGLCAALIAATFWLRPPAHPARRAATLSGIFLITEALLGAVLVKGGYVETNASNARVIVQCVHFSNTMLLVAFLTVTASFLHSRQTKPLAPRRSSPLMLLTLATTLVVGATGSVAALADTLFPAPSLRAGIAQDFAPVAPMLVRMRWLHPASTLILLACLAVLAYRTRRGARAVVTLLGAQLLLGVADILLLAPMTLQVLHLLFADLFWIALVLLAVHERDALSDVTSPAPTSAWAAKAA